MRKLMLQGGVREMLSKNQMKRIIGGASCTAKCVNGTTITCSGHSCAANDYGTSLDGYCTAYDSNGEVIEDGVRCE